jgi:TatD DNase family protein
MLFDSHCHLADDAFQAELPALAARAADAGVDAALCILSADDDGEVGRAGAVTEAWPAVRFAAGIHPHRAGEWAGRVSEARALVERTLTQPGVIAIGEIGLDYHYDTAPRDIQREVFAAQVELARDRGLPVVIHAREAIDDVVAVLKEVGPSVRGVMHCFTGTLDEARSALDIGFHISMSGIVTFPRSTELREVAAFVPADRLLVETDAPYLAPVPRRGHRNEPAWVVHTFNALADVRQTPRPTLADQLRASTEALLPDLVRAVVR